jgi:two-component system, chemotaxis family, CheB/CheR fusion protein
MPPPEEPVGSTGPIEATVPEPGKPVGDLMVVGIGASAGGLKALLEFFSHTIEQSGMAFVVVVHLSPEHESRLPELLQQATRMPVEQVKETVTIRPNRVYVISPNSLLRMYDSKLEPTGSPRQQGGRMTIDVFLETLAEAHKHRSVGIILSGTGSDGTLGMRAVKANGGITMAEAPEEAEYDGMPRNAIASGAVDFVLRAADMPEKIQQLWHNAQRIQLPSLPEQVAPEDASAEAEDAIRDILATLRTRTGHDFALYKRATIVRRLERRLQVNQLRDLTAYRNFIIKHPGETEALLRDLLISVTWFFRDPAVWESIEQRVLPELLEGREGGNLRIWVVGCASGEEVYTLAMLLREQVDAMTSPATVNIFATDIDEEALAFARAGVYPDSIAEHMSHERLRRFFTREQNSYRVNKQLREMIMFAVHNVIQDPPFSRVDLVSCRNLLIYLTRHVQTKVLDLMHFSLKADGFLLLGMSESIEDGYEGFTAVDKANRIFVQQPRSRAGYLLAALPAIHSQRPPTDLPAVGGRRLVSFGELHQRLLEHYAPPSVVVDDHYDIIHLSDGAGHFLQLGAGDPSLNIVKVAPEEFRYEVKAALDQAMETMRTVERTGLVSRRGPQPMALDIKVHPVRDRPSGRTFALIIFGQGSAERPVVQAANEQVAVPETNRLEERVRDMESQLRAAIEQYELQNEELKASNEELQATNEELRATTEELETGKEELQSINEELVTVNQELKNKVDETTRISDDLQNFVVATEIAAMFIDRDLRLLRYTPFAREVFNVIPTDVGRPVLDITHKLAGIDFEASLNQVFDTLHLVEHEARSADGRWYIVRFLPYRTSDDRIRGAVMTFIDITQRKEYEAIGRRTETWAKLIVENVRGYAILTLDRAGIIQTWNPGAAEIFGYTAKEAIGKDTSILFTPEDRAADVPRKERLQAHERGRADDERWQLRKDGTRFFASGIMMPLDVNDEHGFVKVLRDLTQQKHAEERQNELLAAERISRGAAEEANRLKDDFLAMLSHELRNPLALMLMQAEILLRAPEAQKSARLTQSARIIHEMVRAQAQLVEDMLDVSRAKTGKLTIDRQLLPLTFLIADSIGALRKEAEQKKVTLDVQIAESPLIVEADPVRVRQIAWNLLTNALKFTPSGGTIRVRLTRDRADARLDVEDTGEGIPPDQIPHIFEWFKRIDAGDLKRAHAGMGIGLALVRQLVELHEGRLEAYSEGVGKGARFSVWLPLQVASVITDKRLHAPVAEAAKLAGMRILVVDDSNANGDALRDLLELEGASVVVEASPKAAIKLASRQRFDLVISDIAMPEVDGYAMLKAIRAKPANANTPAIAYSGYSGPQELLRARSAGFDIHLTKPVDVRTLLTTIEEMGRRKTEAD